MVGLGLVGFFLTQMNQKVEPSVDAQLLEITDEYYGNVLLAQSLLRRLSSEEEPIRDFFSEDTKEYLNRIFGSIPRFYEVVSNISISDIKTDYVGDYVTELIGYLERDLPIYEKTLALYNNFYDFVNAQDVDARNYVENESEVPTAWVDEWVESEIKYVPAEVIRGIFSNYLGDNYIAVDYSEPMGRIIAIIKDFGEDYE